jgi:hypothetical protein
MVPSLLSMKNTSRAVWVLLTIIIAALLLYVSFAGRTPKPQPQDEFPSETAPPST